MSLNPKVSTSRAGNEKQPVAAPLSRMLRIRHQVAQPVTAAFLAGGVAGAVSRTVVSPLERLKILYQIQSVGREEYKMSVGKGLMKMWREEGWRGLMRGNGTNCVRIIPYSAVQFGSYNLYKKVCVRLTGIPSFSLINRISDMALLLGSRTLSWIRLISPKAPPMRWYGRDYLCHRYLST